MENTAVISRNPEPRYEDYRLFMPAACEDEKFASTYLDKATSAKEILFGIFQDTADHLPSKFKTPQWSAYEAAKELETAIRGQWAVFYNKRVEVAKAAYLASKESA